MASKKKKLLPHAQQLLSGKPHENVCEHAWLEMGTVVVNEQRYAWNHVTDLWTVQDTVTQMKKIAAVSRYRPPFTLSRSVNGLARRILLNDHAAPVLTLLGKLREAARQFKARAGEVHEFHPYFEAFLKEVETGLRYEDAAGEMRTLEHDEFDAALNKPSSSGIFEGHPKVELYCAALSDFFIRLGKRLDEKCRAAAKAFERTASDKRLRAMQYAARLIDRAPRTRIVHVTIRRHLSLHGNPVPQDEMRVCREILDDYLREPGPKRSHLGHCSFLRSFSDLGYCLDAFVFLSDSYLKPAADIASDLTEWWEAFAPKSTGCVASMVLHDQLVTGALKRMTLVTEPDFYVRPARPMGETKKLRHFWCTQFPVKLRATRRTGKAGSYGATAEQRGAGDSLLDAVREEDMENEGVQSELRWRQEREKEEARRSASHKRGARTRAKNRKRAAQKHAERSAHFEACKSRMMYDDEVIDVEAVEVIDVALALRRHSRQRNASPSAGATRRDDAHGRPEPSGPDVTPSAPPLPTVAMDAGTKDGLPVGAPSGGKPITPDIMTAPPVTSATCPVDGSAHATPAQGSADQPPRIARRHTSTIQMRDATGKLRTVEVEVRGPFGRRPKPG